jgi:hypothetical protein
VIQSGAKTGQLGNNVDATLPDGDAAAPPAAAAGKTESKVGAGVAKVNPAEF